ncbi:MAG: S1 RNA-binding domain-containing protein [Deltaproteobacteria bacterium]|nr:S1 RNA-binding domain-containing protein [Deltaproteobacteria bacterium]
MTFWEYLQATQSDDQLKGVTEALATRLGQLAGRGHSVADLIAHYGDDFGHLPPQKLGEFSWLRRVYQGWAKRRSQLQEARQQADLPPLPRQAFSVATAPDELDALVRTARLIPRDVMPDEESWVAVLHAGAELWRACVGIARKEGVIACPLKEGATAEAAHAFESYVGSKHEILELAPHRWLAMRRGEREGVITLSFDLPHEGLLAQVPLYRERLGPTVTERDDASLLDELVLDDLRPWLAGILDQDAEKQAIEAACQSLRGLLEAQPLQARRVGAIFIGRANSPTGVIVADREGELLAQRVIKADGAALAPKALELFNEHNIHHVALPTSAPANEMLSQVEQALLEAEMQPTRVRSAAIAEARVPLTDPPLRLSSSVASALVLARRILDPVKEWSNVDPVSIGIAEYQNDLNQDRLRAALKETMELMRLQRRRGNKPSSSTPPSPRSTATVGRLNPLVKAMNDLQPGMTVQGMITNISHFGAFVNIGLPQEALVHISELSDDFVSNPNEVVSIGQQVTAHVLAVDPARGRISLSLKSPRRMDERRDRGGGQRESGSRTPPQSRSEALANLERLFKK